MGEAYVNVILRMEEQHVTVDDELRALTSIAISLKRIADEMTKPAKPFLTELTYAISKSIKNLMNDEHAQNFLCPRCGKQYKDHFSDQDDPCYLSA